MKHQVNIESGCVFQFNMTEDIIYVTAHSDLPFIVEMAGISYCDGSYRIARSLSDIAVFEYVISGRGTVKENDEPFYPEAGDVYLLHPNCSHLYYADPKDPWVKIWFNIRGPLVMHLLQAYRLMDVKWIPRVPPNILDLFRRFLNMASSNLPLRDKSDRCALIFHEIVMSLSSMIDENEHLTDEISQLLSFIDAHIFEPVALEDMARSIYRSSAYTVRLMRQSTGQTPYAYLINRRIEVSRQLLSSTNLSVKEIAHQLCYADPQYFATVFKQKVGVSPQKFRQQCQNF